MKSTVQWLRHLAERRKLLGNHLCHASEHSDYKFLPFSFKAGNSYFSKYDRFFILVSKVDEVFSAIPGTF